MERVKQLGFQGIFRCIGMWVRLGLFDLRLNSFPRSWNKTLLEATPSVVRTQKEQPGAKPQAIRLFYQKIIEREVQYVRIAASHPLGFNMSCLRRSLVLQHQLRKFGISTTLTYGVRKTKGLGDPSSSMHGHVWLVVESPSILRGFEIDASSQPRYFKELNHEGI
jgi:hypothetical protein